uniref:Uncharacterized protein n=1 Tax=Timema poppense TaxID=170557 RepID=A0A7R9CK10_TIMPO|nr:unnamed protein product [Timema poppensis]
MEKTPPAHLAKIQTSTFFEVSLVLTLDHLTTGAEAFSNEKCAVSAVMRVFLSSITTSCRSSGRKTFTRLLWTLSLAWRGSMGLVGTGPTCVCDMCVTTLAPPHMDYITQKQAIK